MAQPLTPIAHDASTMHHGQTAIVPRFAVITASASGNTAIVAGVAGFKIRVLAYNYVSNGTVNVAWRTGATTVIGGLGYWVANTGKVAPFCPVGWMETASGDDLNVNLSANIAIGGELSYVLVPV